MELNLSVPINSVSFGLLGYNILKELHRRRITPNLFPIGGVDLSSFNPAPDFVQWLNHCIQEAPKLYRKDMPEFRLWHIAGSESSHSNRQNLLSFYETNGPTLNEINTLSNQNKVYFTSEYTTNVFKNFGLSNVETLHLGFDNENFRPEPHPFNHEKIVFGIFGKFEKRKHTEKIIKLWARLYGNNPKYALHLHCFNVHYGNPNDPNQCAQINHQLVAQALGGKQYWNINFKNNHFKTLIEYNKFLNVDIVLDASGNENWSLPSFHTTGLGKYLVVNYANGVKEWANEENAILVPPKSQIECYDGAFFHKGAPYNQGFFFDLDEEAFAAGMDKALKMYEKNRVNTAGLKLQNDFTWGKCVDKIIEGLK